MSNTENAKPGKINYGYSSQSIHVARNAERHRIDPGRHLGAANSEGIMNQFVEIYDNAADECIHFYEILHNENNLGPLLEEGEKLPPLEITVEIKDDWSVLIDDTGRGMPCDTPVDEEGNPTGDEPGIFPIFEEDSAGGKSIHAQGGYGKSTAGMHGAGAAVSKSCTRYFNVACRSGSGNGVYYLRYIDGDRDFQQGDNGLVYGEPLSMEHPIEGYRKYNLPYTGTRIEYLYDDRVLSSTYDGRPCDPYSENELITRIRESLLGIKDRDSIVINFTFKGNYTRITPYDITAEDIVGYDPASGEETCIRIDMESSKEVEGTKAEFEGMIYLNYNPNNNYFEETAIVNRLKMKSSTTTKPIEDILHKGIAKEVDKWLKKHPDLIKPDRKIYAYNRYFHCCTILNLPLAEFSKQQKDELKSTEYSHEFRSQLSHIIDDNISFFKPAVDKIIEYIKHYDKARRNEAKEEEKRKKDRKIELDKEDIKREDDEISSSLEGEVLDKIKNQGSKVKIIPTQRDVDISRVGFFEGDSASEIVAALIDGGEPLTAVTVTGKLPNIYDPKNVGVETVRYMYRKIFRKNYLEYLIFTDPDPDGAHIRMQILSKIAEYAPHMLYQERVFIIRAPYGRVSVNAGETVVIENDIEGILVLEEGEHYVKSYDEMSSAMEQGADYVCTYAGALDVIACCKDIPISTMLTDPKYKIPIKAPTAKELEYLKEMLTPDSQVKKIFTNQFYTERQRVSKYMKGNNKKLKIKTGKDQLTSVSYSITSAPIVNNYKSLTHYNIT